ncbi:glycoside hydrolase family 16 protein [Suillus fuscotomentosus]|uniref:Glycoside hydrolase family 16 protein n=1 Tax=Suillus fuscotomentosus TaxID=1912939 RepID=A0AAD4EHU1_9AGAM|nr:glycoside hydrolase family 16 protein [Suillus fuscotomentosus]KAG1906505.1 glycoside hydrolase family 16 protein [Suillus fuscotomentosus]
MVPQQQRRPPPSAQEYYAVPQSPQGSSMQAPYNQSRPPARSGSAGSQMQSGRGAIAQGVASGQIGGGYGPYSYNPSTSQNNGVHNPSRFSAPASEVSSVTGEKPGGPLGASSTVPPYLWDIKDPDLDDALHNPDPVNDAALDSSFTIFSARGWANASALFILVVGLITLFAGYPIIHYFTLPADTTTGYNLGGINASGQIPLLPGMPSLIDAATPSQYHYRTGSDGDTYQLVFSDEFNTDGRTFWPGDDPFWEAENLHYWATGDLEWYDPQSITTQGGNMVITMSEQPINNLNFMSGMVTTWNKICFTTGYIEVNVSMPGTPLAPGFWPGAWTMGNLGRAGYGGTTQGTWPYSYDTCDLGILPNQTQNGAPAAAATGGAGGGPLSYQPGQRLPSCTCTGQDHPGPNVNTGRGVPEIDIFETQVDVSVFEGQVSQSFQTAPYNYQYEFTSTTPATTIQNSQTQLNSYKGGVYQQALSAVSYISSSNYNGQGFATYGYEWWSNPSNRPQGYIQWYSEGQETWKITSAAIGADTTAEISARLIPEEPMYIILNLGLAPSFQEQDFMHMQFPSEMYIDYVRVYQREGVQNGLTCDPPNRPTADYINNHLNAYTDPNITTWAQGGYQFPTNTLTGC